MDQLPAAREALEELADRLEGELAASGRNARSAVVRGWQAASTAEPEAQALRASGAGWDGVALGVTGLDFWDLHIGLLASEDADGAWRPRVGLHWRNAVDDVARPLATELTSVDLIHFSPVTDEYSAGKTTSVPDLHSPAPPVSSAMTWPSPSSGGCSR